MEPCPAESTKRSRSGQRGSAASNFRKRVHSAVAASAIPMGMPGCPDFAASTASIASARSASAIRRSSVAAGAAQLGQKVVLFEKGEMGGDCLNVGCVPSKALIAAAAARDSGERAPLFGVGEGRELPVDFARVREHVREVIAAIAPNDSAERYRALEIGRAHV